MLHELLEYLAKFVIWVELQTGYVGVMLLMAIESACIPLPSEVIMPFAGSLAATGALNLWWVGFAGAIGCNVGSVLAYEVGAKWGREGVERYGRYIFLSHHDLELADRLFAKRGEIVVFVARLLPVIRTFIALPAGIARMNRTRFHVYTFLGSLPWCLGLAWVGKVMGEHWDTKLKPWFHKADLVIGLFLLAGIIYFIKTRVLGRRRPAKGGATSTPAAQVKEEANS